MQTYMTEAAGPAQGFHDVYTPEFQIRADADLSIHEALRRTLLLSGQPFSFHRTSDMPASPLRHCTGQQAGQSHGQPASAFQIDAGNSALQLDDSQNLYHHDYTTSDYQGSSKHQIPVGLAPVSTGVARAAHVQLPGTPNLNVISQRLDSSEMGSVVSRHMLSPTWNQGFSPMRRVTEPQFTPEKHLINLIHLLWFTARHPHLRYFLSEARSVRSPDLQNWVEEGLSDFVHGLTREATDTHGAFVDAFHRRIMECPALRANYSDAPAFASWLYNILNRCPNLSCALGMSLPSQYLISFMKDVGDSGDILATVFSEYRLEPFFKDWMISIPTLPAKQSTETGRSHKCTHDVSKEGNLCQWKEYMCSWREPWQKLQQRCDSLYEHSRTVWQQHHVEHVERIVAAARSKQLGLPHDSSLPGGCSSDVSNPIPSNARECSEQFEEVAWMLRHLYEEQRDFYGWPGAREAKEALVEQLARYPMSPSIRNLTMLDI